MRQWEPGICNDKSGFLFSHSCDRMPVATCARCTKPVCEEHHVVIDESTLCTSCVKKRSARDPQGGRRGERQDDYYDNPYYYGSHYYGYGYGLGMHDRNDFTEADSESLMNSQSEGDFEGDMSAS